MDDSAPDATALDRANAVLLRVIQDPVIDSGDLDAAELCVLGAAREGLAVERASIWDFDPDTRRIRRRLLQDADGSCDRDPLVLEEAAFPDYFRALSVARAIAAHDAVNDPVTHEFADCYLHPFRIGAMLDAPVRHRGQLIGVLCCEHVGGPRSWTALEQNLAGYLADLVARAMAAAERQRAEEELRAANQHLERRARAPRAAELEEALANLRETQQQLIDSEKMAALGSLVAGVAHEVNTPIGVAVTAMTHLREELVRVDALFRDGTLKRSELESFLGDTGRIAELLLANLNRAAELVRGFKQVAVHQTTDLRGEFDVAAEIRSVLLSLQPETRRRQVAIELECREGLVMDSHAGALAQILTNLVMNSLMHAFEGREAGRIVISARESADHLVLEYSDDGAGMVEENLPRIFEPFFTTRRGRGGTGLGMHIVFNLVNFKLMGKIRADSVPGQGLRIAMRLPMRLG